MAAAGLALLAALVPLALGTTRHLALPALLGAGLLLAAGVVTPADASWAVENVGGAAANVIAFALMAAVLDSAGFFRLAAGNLARRARGSRMRLFWQVVAVSCLAAVFLTNEGSIVMVTLFVAELARWLGLSPRATGSYMTAAVLTAMAAGVAGGTSNLGALVIMALMPMTPEQYLRQFAVPGLCGLVVLTLILGVWARSAGDAALGRAGPDGPSMPVPMVKDPWLVRFAVTLVAATRACSPLSESLGAPVYALPALAAAVLLTTAQLKGALNVRLLWLRAPWQAFGFALGMLVLARGLHRAGLGAWLGAALSGDWSLATLGLGLAVPAAVLTVLPALTVAHLALAEAGLPAGGMAAALAATVLGTGFGAMLNPAGSLAGLLWWQQARRLEVPVSCRTYLGVAFLAVPPALAAALLAATWWWKILGL